MNLIFKTINLRLQQLIRWIILILYYMHISISRGIIL